MTPREFLASRGHLAAAASSAFLLLATVAWAALGGDPDLDAARESVREAGAKLASNPPPRIERPEYGCVPAAWSPSAIAAPAGRGDWVMRPRPKVVPVLIRRKGDPGKPEKPLVLATPGAPRAEAEPGSVHLEWPAPAAAKEAAPVTGIRVLRRGPGDAAPAVVASLPGSARAWDDSAVSPKTAYEYRIQYLTSAATVDGRGESAPSPAAAATTPSGVAIRYVGGADSAALLLVRKCSAGEWREKTATVHPRDENARRTGEIGGVERNTGADWRTGFILLRIWKPVFRYRVPVVHRELDANGVVVQKIVMEDRQIDRYRIAYLDDDGVEHEMWMEIRLPDGAVPVD